MPIDVPDAVRSALALLEADGLDKLTVRRLATELGVKAPALYWHFSSKRALLDHLADAIVKPVVKGLPPRDTPWLQWLETAGSALHTALLDHRDGPRIALGADLRVARSLGEFAERTVDVLHQAGFPLADATRAAGVFVHFVLGRAVEDQTRPDETAEIPFPLMSQGLRDRRGSTPADDFRYALGIVLAGLNATRPASRELP
ncbi:TetR/AcrR family transcriptional regulator C-terminal domain-containing protein [Amycolatopsis rhabdoformis]|uniref:TetR/AcrR family transcriptional regulator C-terminal domain-containing protein n=1 Tax=Amycolatopsis rhabdoformis TaxID=1448059 RepID=A0ABZ1I3C6_9PSEU|nr:TetR/AcrR family transcriptional regulator C-terminal domain-containing protein [Amycolatopsis rhabdoformis]WSE27979.1 TetR/AcrR family transcriptional regulator C-terminal domain-containing protein [Amycolatopsis rhabdoformis]